MREAIGGWVLVCLVALGAFMLGFVSALEALAPPKEAAPAATLRGSLP